MRALLRAARAIALLALVVLLAGCPRPGSGPRAERGYERARVVIEALHRYREATGGYPESLNQLLGRYLDDDALALPTRPGEEYPLEYARAGAEYTLTFRYSGPGMRHCTYASATSKWACGTTP
jgi:hypothetical protein